MSAHILTFNAGSSSIKVGIFAIENARPVRVSGAMLDLQRTPLRLRLDADGTSQEIPLSAKPSKEVLDKVRLAVADRSENAEECREFLDMLGLLPEKNE